MADEIIIQLLKKNPRGLSITELVKLSKQSRSLVRTSLARLEGATLVTIHQVGMAKLYLLNQFYNEKYQTISVEEK